MVTFLSWLHRFHTCRVTFFSCLHRVHTCRVTFFSCYQRFHTCRVTFPVDPHIPSFTSISGNTLPLASPTVCMNNYPGLLQSNPSHNNQPNRRVLEIRRSERFSGLTPIEEIPRRYVASRRVSRFPRVMEVAYAPDVAPYKRALPPTNALLELHPSGGVMQWGVKTCPSVGKKNFLRFLHLQVFG